MSLLNCCENSRITERCPKHNQHYISLFCTHKQCMQPMCVKCTTEHQQVHSRLNLGDTLLVDLRQAQDFSIESAKKQLGAIRSTKTKIHKPAEAMDKCIDRFFYGSTNRRENMLKDRFQKMNSQFKAQLLVNSIETDHQFSIPDGFKQKYFSFLDDIMGEVSRKHEVSNFSSQKYQKRKY